MHCSLQLYKRGQQNHVQSSQFCLNVTEDVRGVPRSIPLCQKHIVRYTNYEYVVLWLSEEVLKVH